MAVPADVGAARKPTADNAAKKKGGQAASKATVDFGSDYLDKLLKDPLKKAMEPLSDSGTC